MLASVTANAECDQVLKSIVAELTARFQVMYVQISWRAAALTPPPVSLEHLFSKCFVFC